MRTVNTNKQTYSFTINEENTIWVCVKIAKKRWEGMYQERQDED